MADIQIRDAILPGDSGEWVRLAENCRIQTPEWRRRELFEAFRAPPDSKSDWIALRARIGDEDAGFVFALRRAGRWTIRALGVLPKLRRQGVGSQLLSACIPRLERPPARLSSPSIDLRNTAATRLFEAAGFQMSPDQTLRMKAPSPPHDLPVDLPPRYTFRTYRDGDDSHWIRIYNLAFRDLMPNFNPVTQEKFRRQFLKNPYWKPERLFFLCHNETPVGSIASWRDNEDAHLVGVVHWVILDPTHHGKRLGRPMMAQCMNRLRIDGWDEIYLTTDTAFHSAVSLYKKLGFETLYANARFWKVLES